VSIWLADRWPLTHEQSETPPPPVAVHLRQPGVAHPLELRFHLGQDVLRIAARSLDPSIELLVELSGRALDDLKIHEYASWSQRRNDLAEQRLLALVREVVDSET